MILYPIYIYLYSLNITVTRRWRLAQGDCCLRSELFIKANINIFFCSKPLFNQLHPSLYLRPLLPLLSRFLFGLTIELIDIEGSRHPLQ